jgi:hypothetical protein
MAYDSWEDFVDKVDNEGGVMGAIEYGIIEEDIPDDGSEDSEKLYELWAHARTFMSTINQIDKILNKYTE